MKLEDVLFAVRRDPRKVARIQVGLSGVGCVYSETAEGGGRGGVPTRGGQRANGANKACVHTDKK